VQDVAYSLLLRMPRRELHARIAKALETKFSEVAENKPELLARHCAEAGHVERAAALRGKAGQRSAQRSAPVEATEQLGRALDLIASLPSTAELRREEIKLQVELITPLLHVRGYAARETRAAVERAHLLIERSEALGEPPEDPLLLFSVLCGFWVANLVAFNGDVMSELAVQYLALAEKQSAAAPLMIGRQLAIRFGQDVGAASLSRRSISLWLLGYTEGGLADAERALEVARDARHSPTLTYLLNFSFWTHIHCGDYTTAAALIDEYVRLQSQKGSPFWGAWV
jgi:hypothetical protein